MSEREKRVKAKQKNVEELSKALQRGKSKSLLESMELDEDDAVYDLLDDDEYAKLVESRRSGVDFVVDDEGHGYYDDGEEHIGVAEDEYDHKKRLREQTEDADKKLARKTQKLINEAGAQQKNNMLQYVKPIAPAVARTIPSKPVGGENTLDIDNLLKEVQSSTPQPRIMNRGLTSSRMTGTNMMPAALLNRKMVPIHNSNLHMRRPMMSHLPPSTSSTISSYNDNYHDPHTTTEDTGYDAVVSQDYMTYDNHDNYDTTHSPITDKSHSGKKSVTFSSTTTPLRSDDHNEQDTPSHTNDIATAIVSPNTSEVESKESTQKISLSKTTKKLSFHDLPKKSSDGILKPQLVDTSASLGLQDIMGASFSQLSQSSDSSQISTPGGGNTRVGTTINHEYWLQRYKASTDGTDVITPTSTTTTSDMKAVDITMTDGDEYVNMYWIDACENNGVIYLFGKIPIYEPNTPVYYVSCCVIVHGAVRNLFVLPKATGDLDSHGNPVRANMSMVYEETKSVLVPSIIPKMQGQGLKCKPVKRKYAFEYGDIPREENEYLKVVYSAQHPALALSECGIERKYIERIFGSTSSPLELFLLKRKLLGPCWITIRNPRMIKDSLSWCKLEIGVEDPKFISRINRSEREKWNCPPLTSMCVSMKTVLNPSTHVHEIVAISGLIHTRVEGEKDTLMDPKSMKRFTYIRSLGLTCGTNYPANFPHDLSTEIKKVAGTSGVLQSVPNERALISIFFARVQQEDPDIFASHNLFGFEFDVLLSRAIVNKIADWSRIGRLRRTKIPKNIMDKDITSGRILCDTYKAAKEFLRETSYSLTSLASSQLNYNRIEVDPVDVPKYFYNAMDIIKIAEHTAIDAMLVQKLVLKLQVVPLTKQLTNLSGNLWSRTVKGARAERIEYLLLHEFHALKYILPEKKGFDQNNGNTNESGTNTTKDGTNKKNTLSKKSTTQHMKKVDMDNIDDVDVDMDEGTTHRVGGSARTRAKAAYAGGLVLEPKKGLYDTYILLLDFNSLYPSLIQEYNLCFTTIEWTKYMHKTTTTASTNEGENKENVQNNGTYRSLKRGQEGDNDDHERGLEGGDDDDDVDDPNSIALSHKALPPLPDTNKIQGVLPRVIRTLVDRRKEVKNLLKKEKDSAMKQSLDIRQKALKLTANSMYGCLGFAFSRFYARPIAALVTSMGRTALQRTVDQARNQFGLDVIYGDTDSVMINTNSIELHKVKELGYLIKKEVNKLYKCLELDLDGIFKSMLLLKKKKYAALSIKEHDNGEITYEKELKGLDLVRRDWCPLSKDTGKYVVDQILSGQNREDIIIAIHDYLTELAIKVRKNEIDLAQYVITKGLNKNPKDYPDTKGQPHLQVALAMLKANKPVNIGDHIPYVICVQSHTEGATEATMRAYHPDEVYRNPEKLTLDYEWYLSNQILPPISRLCEPIEGTSNAALSQCLGLDASKYGQSSVRDDGLDDDDWGFTAQSKLDDSERFRDCIKLMIKCASCQSESEFKGATECKHLNCPVCGAMNLGRKKPSDTYAYLSNKVTLLVRKCMRTYYDCWFICDDPTCRRRTMQQPVAGLSCVGDCHGRLVQEYTDHQLHTQLKYLEKLFDLENAVITQAKSNSDPVTTPAKMTMDHLLSDTNRDVVEVYRLVHQHMINTINNSAYNWVRPSIWSTVFGKLSIQ